MEWIRSTFSYAHGNCIEVAVSDGHVLLRDSKDPDGPRLRFTPDEWSAFIAGVTAGQFPRPL
jgi:uncharacterized protein DUF397